MGILSWLRSNDDARTERHEPEQATEAIDRIMALNPRLGMAQHCRERLASSVAASLRYATALVTSLPEPHEASARTWSSDLYMRAFFAQPEDLTGRISRSEELRGYFEQNPDSEHAFAVLGMSMIERHVLGIALEGNAVRRDVAQTTVCFGDHRVRICGRSESELRLEIVRRVIDQLALTGLAKLAKIVAMHLTMAARCSRHAYCCYSAKAQACVPCVGAVLLLHTKNLFNCRRRLKITPRASET